MKFMFRAAFDLRQAYAFRHDQRLARRGLCHAVRAPGSKWTMAPPTRDGSCRWNWPMIVTLPVKLSAGASTVFISACRAISIGVVLVLPAKAGVL